MLEINEIFGPTIQGEGKLVGTPSIFIRFGKCNFKCEGFQVEYETPSGVKKCACDSYYAVDTEFKDTWTKYKSYDEIVNEVDVLLSKYPNNYKIDNGHKVTIETNASLNLEFKEEYQKKLLFSMSVKLSNSLEPINKRINKETLRKILTNTNESYLKFVIGKDFLNDAKEEITSYFRRYSKM